VSYPSRNRTYPLPPVPQLFFFFRREVLRGISSSSGWRPAPLSPAWRQPFFIETKISSVCIYGLGGNRFPPPPVFFLTSFSPFFPDFALVFLPEVKGKIESLVIKVLFLFQGGAPLFLVSLTSFGLREASLFSFCETSPPFRSPPFRLGNR